MKRLYLLLAVGVLACACQREQDFDTGLPQNRLMASLEGATKTVLSPSGAGVSQVLWSEGDQLAVSIDGSTDTRLYTLTEGAGTRQAVFTGTGRGSHYTAVYPAEMVRAWNEGQVLLDLPVEQPYAAGTFGPGSFPMLAAGGENLSFRNIESVLRLSLLGTQSITRIVFQPANPGTKVSGAAWISLADPAEPALSMLPAAIDSVVLQTGGVKLNESEATDFFLVLPAQTYKDGFVLKIWTADGYMRKVYDADFTMERGQLHAADPLTVKLTSVVEASAFLKGSGSAEDPFLLYSLADLTLMRKAVNTEGGLIPMEDGSALEAVSAWYKLMADIDLSDAYGKDAGRSWEPIGTLDLPFDGHFLGNRHRISHLYIKGSFTENCQGFFGAAGSASEVSQLTVEGEVLDFRYYAGLIAGTTSGTVSHCVAEGTVSSDSGAYAGGIAGKGGDIFNCINRASVHADLEAGGIAGENYFFNVVQCINEGAVDGNTDVGGIVGVSSGNTSWCRNTGTITGGYDVGGIAGNQNAYYVFNCTNEGTVKGDWCAGGISAYARQGSYIFNSVNRGAVSGGKYVGGICGNLDSNSSAWGNGCAVRGCVNLGPVEGEESAGSLCGASGGETDSGYLASEVTNSYWLYDPGLGLGMAQGIGDDAGISYDNQPLSDARMKGEVNGPVLFGSKSFVRDALNAWSYVNIHFFNPNYPLQGWVYSDTDGYPALSGFPATRTGSVAVFSVSPGYVDMAVPGGPFEVKVTSTEGYTFVVPSWIRQTAVQSNETEPYTTYHFFEVDPNTLGTARHGVVEFTDYAGTVFRVSVSQAAPYMDVDVQELSFSGSGETQHVNLKTSLRWNASSDAPWCLVGPESGVGDKVLAVRCLQNPSTQARAALVTIVSDDGGWQRQIAVVQGGTQATEEGDWKTQPFVHQSLAMRFTATWCGWCPRMNASVHEAMEQYPGHLLHLALHAGGSDLQFGKVAPLLDLYEIGGYPTGMVDGRIRIENDIISVTSARIVEVVKETESLYGTDTGMAIKTSLSGRTATVDVDVYAKKAGSYKITVLLVEDGIVNPQSDYEAGDHPAYVHDDVARMALTDVLGESFTVEADYTVTPFHFSATIPSSYVPEGMRALVYVQESYGSRQKVRTADYGDYYIDNCATVNLGDELRLALEGDGGGSSGGGGGNGNEGIVPGDDINLH